MILEGRVRVNGQVVTELGSKADPENDHIKVDGKLINPKQPKTYLMLNKPVGYVTTLSDPEQRKTVQDLMGGIKVRVYPVGRLDYNTEGMLLLTNDGDFAHLITHPSYELPKTYLVKVKGVLDDRAVNSLETGLYLRDGRTAPARVRRISKEAANSWVEITIHEGRKRQVRRMIDHVGNSVIRLKRVKIGSLSLGDIPVGTYRHLTLEEVKLLQSLAEGTAGVASRSSAPKLKASQERFALPAAKKSTDRAGERRPWRQEQTGPDARPSGRKPVGRKSMPRMAEGTSGAVGRSSTQKTPMRSSAPAGKQSKDWGGDRGSRRYEQKGTSARPVSRKPEGRMNTRSFAEGSAGTAGRSSTQKMPVRQTRPLVPVAKQSTDRGSERRPWRQEQTGPDARPSGRKPVGRKSMPRMAEGTSGAVGRSSTQKTPMRSSAPAGKQSKDWGGDRGSRRYEQKGTSARPVSRKPEGRMNTRSFAEGSAGTAGRSSTQKMPVRQARPSAPAAKQSKDWGSDRGSRRYEQKGTSARPGSRKPEGRKNVRGSGSANKSKSRFPR